MFVRFTCVTTSGKARYSGEPCCSYGMWPNIYRSRNSRWTRGSCKSLQISSVAFCNANWATNCYVLYTMHIKWLLYSWR